MALISALVRLSFSTIIAKHLGFDVAIGLTATGNTSQANAYQITANYNQFTVVTSTNNSTKLPTAISSANGVILIRNDDTSDNLIVYPAVGDNFNILTSNTAITIFPNETGVFTRISDTSWVAQTRSLLDLATGITGILPVANGGTATSTLGVGTTWTPTLTGFSANPATNDYSYTLIGKICFINFRQSVDGTSNATGYTFTLPFTAVTRTNSRWNFTASVVDNGVGSATLGRVIIQSAGTIGTITRDDLGTVFTASGGKRASFQGWYEIA
jgi:hypothetical protein